MTNDSPYKEISGKTFNYYFYRCPMIRLTNETENHNGFQYNTGLNVDTKQFVPNEKCGPGGLYFCHLKDIFDWIESGDNVYIRLVTIPDDARVYTGYSKFKTDKLILSERVKIGDFFSECEKIFARNTPFTLFYTCGCSTFTRAKAVFGALVILAYNDLHSVLAGLVDGAKDNFKNLHENKLVTDYSHTPVDNSYIDDSYIDECMKKVNENKKLIDELSNKN